MKKKIYKLICEAYVKSNPNDYNSDNNSNLMIARENYANQIESILEDSRTYLEEQRLDYEAHRLDNEDDLGDVGENGEHECLDGTNGVGNIDGTDGRCVVCGKTDLM